MTVETEQSAIVFTGIVDGVALNVPFPVQATTELKVRYGVADTLATLGVHYTVALVPPDYLTATVTPMTGFAATSGGTVSVRREVPYTQPTDIPTLVTLASSRLEQMFDRIVFIAQQLRDALVYSLKFPTTDQAAAIGLLPTSTDRASKYLGFDSAGKPIAVAAAAGTTVMTAFGVAWVALVDIMSAALYLGVPDVNVKWFGAKGDGIADDLVAWNACVAYCQANHRVMRVPAGIYNWSDTPVTITGSMTIKGDGEWCTFLLQKGVNKNGLWFDMNYATGGGIEGISIHAESTNPNGTKSAGYGLRVTRVASGFRARNFDIHGFAYGIQEYSNFYAFFDNFQVLMASVAAIHNAPKSGGFTLDSAGVFFSNAKLSNYATTSPNSTSTGILVQSAAGNHYAGIDATVFGRGVWIKPTTGQFIAHLFFDRVLSDTSVTDGWVFDSTDGSIVNINMHDCWSCFCTNGRGIVTTGVNSLDDIKWVGGNVRENGQHGYYGDFGSNVKFIGTTLGRNGSLTTLTYSGASLASGLTSIKFTGCGIGNFSSSAAWSQLHGIYVDAAFAGLVSIVGNDFPSTGSGGSPIAQVSATATYQIRGNTPAQLGLDLAGGEFIRGVSNAGVAAGATRYLGPNGETATEVNASYIIGRPVSIRSLQVALSTAPTAGETVTVTLRKNGVATAVVAVVSDAEVSEFTSGANLAFAANDIATLQAVYSGGAATSTIRWAVELSG
jgi:hypothetical protein